MPSRLCGCSRFLLLVVFAAAITPAHSWAQTTCCDTATGSWLQAESEAACREQGYVPATATTMGQVGPCLQKAQQQAAEALRKAMGDVDTGTPAGGAPAQQAPTAIPTTMPTLDGTDIQGMIDGAMGAFGADPEPPPQCCDVDTGEWSDPDESGACDDDDLADTADNLEATQVCRPAASGAWNTDDFEPNIPNGGLETWRDDNRPQLFVSHGSSPEQQGHRPGSFDMQVVFRSDDAHTGSSSARLQNYDMRAEALRRDPRAAIGLPDRLTIPSGFVSCDDPCPADAGQGAGQGGGQGAADVIGLPVKAAKSHLCGSYKGWLSPIDQMNVSVSLIDGDQIIGGSNLAEASARFVDSSAEWVNFALPMNLFSGNLDQVDKVGIQVLIQPRGAFGSARQVSVDSVVKVDSFHFCDLMGLTVHHPAVLSLSQEPVADDEEETLGVQTFVNLDNDDKDAKFDHEDTDGVAKEDELVKVRAYLPLESRGEVELRVSGNASAVKLWNDQHKLDAFDEANEMFDVSEFMALDPSGSKLERIVWVEGIEPSKSPKDIEIQFRFENARERGDDVDDKVTITVLGIESIAWRGKTGDDKIEPDPKWPSELEPKGQRVFPGKRWQANGKPENESHDKVEVVVTLNVEPVREVPILFRSFDIDDPTADSDEVDDESSASDNRGEEPNVWGGFPNPDDEIYRHPFVKMQETFEFEVTMQPGDNFRLVANADEDALKALHNNDSMLSKAGPRHSVAIVDRYIFEATSRVGLAKLPEEEKYSTEVLTVWRKLWVEVDSMQSVADNIVDGIKVVGYQTDRSIATASGKARRQAWLQLDANLYDLLPDESKSGVAGYKDNFAGGWLKYKNNFYKVGSSTAKADGHDVLHVNYPMAWGEFSQDEMGGVINNLVDDDELSDGDSLPALDTSRLAEVFEHAYIVPEMTPENPTAWAEFKLHLQSSEKPYLQRVFAETFDLQDHHDDDEIWIAFLLNAFQGPLAEDADGENGLAGVADGDPGVGPDYIGAGDHAYGAAVFQESGRENAAAYAGQGAAAGWRMEDVAPHELGHLFGGTHRGNGLMSYDKVKGIWFDPVTLDRIRSRKHP